MRSGHGRRTDRAGTEDADLDQRLNDELDRFNAVATPDVAPAVELTAKAEPGRRAGRGSLGLDLGQAAGTWMTWVHEDQRGAGLGGSRWS